MSRCPAYIPYRTLAGNGTPVVAVQATAKPKSKPANERLCVEKTDEITAFPQHGAARTRRHIPAASPRLRIMATIQTFVHDNVALFKGTEAMPTHLVMLNQPLEPGVIRFLWDRTTKHVCADGAANRLLEACPDLTPDAVVGDFDSLAASTRREFESRGVTFHRDASEDHTDMEKSLRWLNENIDNTPDVCIRLPHMMRSRPLLTCAPRWAGSVRYSCTRAMAGGSIMSWLPSTTFLSSAARRCRRVRGARSLLCAQRELLADGAVLKRDAAVHPSGGAQPHCAQRIH